MSVSQWGAAEWGAFGQVGALVVATVAGVLVWLQVRQGRQVREDQTRPYVIVDFEFKGLAVMLTVRNSGTTPARDVRFGFEPALQSPLGDDPSEFAVFHDGIPMLAPGRAISHMFGTGPQFFPDGGGGVPLRYEARVTYSNLEGKRYEDPPLVLDLLPFKNSAVERDDLHEVARNLKDIKAVLKSWSSEGRIRVNTEMQTEITARHQQWRDELMANREKRAESSVSDES